jgi:hypothetical protein
LSERTGNPVVRSPTGTFQSEAGLGRERSSPLFRLDLASKPLSPQNGCYGWHPPYSLNGHPACGCSQLRCRDALLLSAANGATASLLRNAVVIDRRPARLLCNEAECGRPKPNRRALLLPKTVSCIAYYAQSSQHNALQRTSGCSSPVNPACGAKSGQGSSTAARFHLRLWAATPGPSLRLVELKTATPLRCFVEYPTQ